MAEKDKNNSASEAVVLFTVVDEKQAQIKPLDGTYEVEYKYQNEEAKSVLTGDVKKGEGIAPTGVTEFPAKDAIMAPTIITDEIALVTDIKGV